MAIRIMLVDDHAAVRRGLKVLLETHLGSEIVGEAEDGIDALEKAVKLKPDVVLLDLTMPRMGGLEACRLIRKDVPQCEVLIVTQHDSREMMREAIAAGARGYVVKSQVVRDLVQAVETVSQHKQFGIPDAKN